MRVRRGARRARKAVLLGCAAALLAGCASMPDSGDVTAVDQSPRSEGDSQVRVYGVPPQDGAQPTNIVRSFLDATTSDEADFRTATQYLAKSAKRTWRPFQVTNVLQERPKPEPKSQPSREDANGYTVTLSGSQVAAVDDNHAYTPEEKPYRRTIHLVKENGQWRIDRLPNGLVLGLSDFQRIYRSVNKYYFASYKSEAQEPKASRNVLVADPVYLRQRIKPITSSVAALLSGPTDWLNQVTSSAFPPGTRLAARDLALDDSNALHVRLSKQAVSAGSAQCKRMAAQLFFTVQDMTRASKVSEVELQDGSGNSLCALTQEQADRDFAPSPGSQNSGKEYFIDADHKVVAMSDSATEPTPVRGPFGTGKTPLRSVAISRAENTAAGVSSDGRSLYVAGMEDGIARGGSLLTSNGSAKDADAGLTAPSWDGLGDLWIADRDAHGSRLLRIREGKSDPERVAVPGLGGRRIKAIKVAADGIRIAVLVEDKGRTTLQLGRVERGGTAQHPELSVQELRPIAPQLEDVVAASWAGGSRLVVVGRESGGVQQMQFMETDGSASNAQTLPGVNGVKAVAASEDETRPLIADATEGIVRLPPDANWKTVAKDGTAPVYPG
ncbi:lipoprotein LpqB-like beta-propeller protein [Streptomyces sp. 2333.5]|uniref:LpqB family beta-propeller domain-containing protein n=1 Tax=unclassified Streptomyces TaxID=2593676 RepID=UPI00089C1A54|nr:MULTISPECIES: LpqB family beta-propeller domain-containing protein [unclassified Streptomyces]PJJ02314.1 lipoprotein LpqB-like beta-propeller protein [Streptomyces sp. 2333.5]SED04560.1 Lipoprotein LpqB beta-propeller domain-containing protein [Streptomyces sp. 2314.4]SED91085.1 two-component system, OmpR family, sensor histidine kinase MtrB [Streptomyces sp. 2112.2]